MMEVVTLGTIVRAPSAAILGPPPTSSCGASWSGVSRNAMSAGADWNKSRVFLPGWRTRFLSRIWRGES